MSNKNKLKESTSSYDDTPEVKIGKNDYEKLPNKDALSQSLGDKGEITLTNEGEMNGNSIQQAFFAGLKIGNESHEGTFVGDPQYNKIALRAWEKYKGGQMSEATDLPEIPDEETMEREFEYGVKSEGFDKLMEELKKSGGPKIQINEKINPRIKKSDLINYIKNKNNVK